MSAVGAADGSPGRKPGDQATRMLEPRRGDRQETARHIEQITFRRETRLLPQSGSVPRFLSIGSLRINF